MIGCTPDGLPSENEYIKINISDVFRAMEEFSDDFLTKYKSILREYKKKVLKIYLTSGADSGNFLCIQKD